MLLQFYLKDNVAYVAIDYKAELIKAQKQDNSKNYQLSTAQSIKFGVERFKCTEMLIKPDLIEKKSKAVMN